MARYSSFLAILFLGLVACATGMEPKVPGKGGSLDPKTCPTSCKVTLGLHIDSAFTEHERYIVDVAINAITEGTGGRQCFSADADANLGIAWDVIRLQSRADFLKWGYDLDIASNAIGLTDFATGRVFLVSGELDDESLEVVTAHELFHVLGFNHTPDSEFSIMRSYVDPTAMPNGELSKGDRVRWCKRFRMVCSCG